MGAHRDESAPIPPVVSVSQSPFSVSPRPSPAAPPVAPNARASLLEQLLASVGEAAGAGDIEAARIAHEAAGKLLAAPRVEGAGATVVDLAQARRKRGGQ